MTHSIVNQDILNRIFSDLYEIFSEISHDSNFKHQILGQYRNLSVDLRFHYITVERSLWRTQLEGMHGIILYPGHCY